MLPSSNLSTLDWTILGTFLFFLLAIASYTKRYTYSVADFLAANRCARRYLLAVSGNAVNFGAVSFIAWFEMYYRGGFSAVWWGMAMMISPVVVGLTGWLIYRFRQTRAMTLAQFFEMRYGRRFRIFAGLLAFLSGILNFGIFPAVGARFFVYFCGFPETLSILGVSVSSFALVMLILLSLSLYFTFAGGQIAVMVTDFVQGTFTNVMLIVIVGYLMTIFNWSQVSEALTHAPDGASMINPFRAGNVEDFDFWYFAIGILGNFVYNYISWQGSQGYRCAAINPKEQKIGQALNYLRSQTEVILMVTIAICIYTMLHHPDHPGFQPGVNHVTEARTVDTAAAPEGDGNEAVAAQAKNESLVLRTKKLDDIHAPALREAFRQKLGRIDDAMLQDQMLVPVGMSMLLGSGLFGGMCAIMLAGFITSHDTYMHSWGSIFVQDVLLPFRKKPLSAKEHLFWLRMSIFGVAVFIFIWSLLYPLKETIFMYFAITGAIYMGGAGAVIVGGLYWRKGTATAAWWTMSVGSVLSVSGMVLRQQWPNLHASYPGLFVAKEMPINSQWFLAITILTSITLYVVISLLTCKEDFDLDAMLHREEKIDKPRKSWWREIIQRLGVDEDFDRRDKITYAVCFGWCFLWLGVLVVGIVYCTFINGKVSDASWLAFWKFWGISYAIAVVAVTIGLIFGGTKDLVDLFRRLKISQQDDTDDGTV